ncbi:MAG: aminopeptidase [Candidatus Ornithospirochaeta sp.]
MKKEIYAERLSDLVLSLLVVLENGDWLNIVVSPDAYYYAENMAEEAYRRGAAYVSITISDLRLDRSRALYQSKDEVQFVPSYMREFVREGEEMKRKNVRIECRDERIDLNSTNDEVYNLLSQSIRKAQKSLSEKYMGNDIMWCVCCAPGPKWAKAVLGQDKSEEDLADILASILFLDTPDYKERWLEEDDKTMQRLGTINSLSIKSLHFKSPVTDLHVGFRREAFFEGCSSLTTGGKVFWPNLPTVEIFNTPDNTIAEGYVTTTRPVSVMGNETEDVKLYFENGKCTKAEAKVGQSVMDKYLETDEGARRLGEVALVDVDSPISRTGLIFGSILIDENASCHLALGQGYSSNLHIGDKDPKDYGCNESLVHTDFMVGSPDMKIVAETYDGREVTIMENGRFVF